MERGSEREAKLKGSNCFNIACFDDTLECFSLRKSVREKNRWSFRKSSRALQQQIRPALIEPAQDFTFLSNRRSYGNKQALAVAAATAAAAEAAVAAAQAAAHVAQLTGTGRSKQGNLPTLSPILELSSQEDMAAIKIQSAFRGYLARKSLGTLKGRQRLQALARGRVGQRQTKTTMRYMQELVRAQAAARGRRPRGLCDEEALATLLHPWERHGASVTAEEEDHDGGKCRREEWNDGTQTVEEIHARLQEKHDAVIKRERAMAYAVSHQQLMGGGQYSSKSSQLGWNWLERWMAARPWENRRPSPAKETRPPISRHLPPARESPPRQSFSKRRASARTVSSARRATMTPVFNRVSAPPKRLPVFASSGGDRFASASLRDDLSVASFSGTPSYMATTESARAKLRSHSTPKQRLAPASVYSDRPRYSTKSLRTKFRSNLA